MFEFYPKDALVRLEMNQIIDRVCAYCHADITAQQFKESPFLLDKETIEHELECVENAHMVMGNELSLPLLTFENLHDTLPLLKKQGYTLTLSELLRYSKIVHIIRNIYQFFTEERRTQYKALWNIIKESPAPLELHQQLSKILDSSGEMRLDASQKLLKINHSISAQRKLIDKVFNSELNKYKQRDWLTDNYESIRNGIRVLAVKAEKKRQLKGIIHDESKSGHTCFIEPLNVVEHHYKLQEYLLAFDREVQHILVEISDYLRTSIHEIQTHYQHLITIDLVWAKALLARELGAHKPNITTDGPIEIINGFHPLLDLKLRESSQRAIPFTLTLNDQNHILLLSGPNAGGKSITLKALGLFQLMLQKGLLLPLEAESKMRIFEQIYIDIGDQQSIDNDLSTYSSHLRNMRHFIQHGNDKTLLLIDEFGSGTDPQIGGALAESILYALNKKRCFGIITTHYTNLKIFAFHTKGILNAAMLFDKDQLSPSYQLKTGQPGSSFAFEIAEKSGLSANVIKAARKKTGKSQTHVEDLLVSLQQDKAQLNQELESLERKQANFDRLTQQYDQLKKDLDYQRRKLKLAQKEFKLQQLANESRALDELIAQLKANENLKQAKQKLKGNKMQRQEIVEHIKSDIQALYYSDSTEQHALQKGDYAILKTGGFEGEIISIQKQSAVLMVGGMQIDVPLIDLKRKTAPLTKPSQARSQMDIVDQSINFNKQLDIRGVRAIEAIDILRAYVDRALIANVHQLNILHGKGNGVLRNAVLSTIKEYKQITEHYHPKENAGGNGITILVLS